MAKASEHDPCPVADATHSPTRRARRPAQARRRQLSPVWFYDELGSFLFDSICELPEYYLTRTELQIMREHAREMAHHIGPDAALIEFGSGTSMKTRLLLDHLEQPAAYVPVDISRDHLLEAARQSGARLSDAAHHSGVRGLHAAVRSADADRIRAAARRLLSRARRSATSTQSRRARAARSACGSIIGRERRSADRHRSEEGSAQCSSARTTMRAGVTAEFNLNALRHMNRELGADFDLDAFEHLRGVGRRPEPHRDAPGEQARPGRARRRRGRVASSSGEHLRTEYCHKYTLESFADLAATAGLVGAAACGWIRISSSACSCWSRARYSRSRSTRLASHIYVGETRARAITTSEQTMPDIALARANARIAHLLNALQSPVRVAGPCLRQLGVPEVRLAQAQRLGPDGVPVRIRISRAPAAAARRSRGRHRRRAGVPRARDPRPRRPPERDRAVRRERARSHLVCARALPGRLRSRGSASTTSGASCCSSSSFYGPGALSVDGLLARRSGSVTRDSY